MLTYHERKKSPENPTDASKDVIVITLETNVSNCAELLSQFPPKKEILRVRPLYNLRNAIECALEDRDHCLINMEDLKALAGEIAPLFPYVSRNKLEERV